MLCAKKTGLRRVEQGTFDSTVCKRDEFLAGLGLTLIERFIDKSLEENDIR